MGYLRNGEWHTGWYDTSQTGGEFVREESRFRQWVTADGSGGFRAEPGRYHLYVSLACPWAHRTLIFRALKQLEDVVSLSVVDPVMGDDGWVFDAADPSLRDMVNGVGALRELYLLTDSHYTGRVTVPILWDKQLGTIVNNESAEIIRMFNSAFDAFTKAREDYYPKSARAEIDAINAFIYERINNGVYRCGFAGSQKVYERAFDHLFQALDEIEARLGRARYLVGNRITEADWRLFTTLVRFDAVYYSHFKCNRNRIADFPNLSNYLRDLYQVPSVAGTVDMDHIKRHYYASHRHINPTGIVPKGPALHFDAPHDRARFVAESATSLA